MFKRSLAAGVACAAAVSGSAFAATSTINNFTVSIAITMLAVLLIDRIVGLRSLRF